MKDVKGTEEERRRDNSPVVAGRKDTTTYPTCRLRGICGGEIKSGSDLRSILTESKKVEGLFRKEVEDAAQYLTHGIYSHYFLNLNLNFSNSLLHPKKENKTKFIYKEIQTRLKWK